MNNEELVRKYIEEKQMGHPAGTISSVNCNMKLFFKYVRKPVEKITKDDLIKYYNDAYNGKILSKWGKPISADYLEVNKVIVKSFFKWYYKWEEGLPVPEIVRWLKPDSSKKRRLTPQDVLSEETRKKLIAGCTNARDKFIVSLYFDIGGRASEIVDLNVGSVSHDSEGVYVAIRTLKLKTSSAPPFRKIALNYSLPYYEEYIKGHPDRGNPDAPLIVSRIGNRLDISTIRKLLIHLKEKQGINQRICPKIFRHSRMSDLSEKGCNEQNLRIFGGWCQDSRMPSTYAHLSDKTVRKVVFNLDNNQSTVDAQIQLGVEQRIKQEKEKWLQEAVNLMLKQQAEKQKKTKR